MFFVLLALDPCSLWYPYVPAHRKGRVQDSNAVEERSLTFGETHSQYKTIRCSFIFRKVYEAWFRGTSPKEVALVFDSTIPRGVNRVGFTRDSGFWKVREIQNWYIEFGTVRRSE